MSEFLKDLRAKALAEGVSPEQFTRIEAHIVAQWGGTRVHYAYIPKRTLARREAVAELVRAGVPQRTARWKAAGF